MGSSVGSSVVTTDVVSDTLELWLADAQPVEKTVIRQVTNTINACFFIINLPPYLKLLNLIEIYFFYKICDLLLYSIFDLKGFLFWNMLLHYGLLVKP